MELKADYEFMKFTNASHLSIKRVPTSRIAGQLRTRMEWGKNVDDDEMMMITLAVM